MGERFVEIVDAASRIEHRKRRILEPGDILQIRDHLVTTKTKIEYVFKDGSTETETNERTAKRGHHTAIVNGKLDANGGVRTLE